MIPQYVPKYNRYEIAKEITKYVLGDNFFSENLKTEEFEIALAQFLGIKYCVTVTNGTMALSLALLAKGIKAKDTVLIPNITMMSTQASVELLGAKPIFVDVDAKNLCMDLEKAKLYIENCNIKAVIYVTLNGRSHDLVELEAFERFCIANGVQLIMDNAQAFGSKYSNDRNITCLNNSIGCFSLSFHKLLATGQGGFCVTNDDYMMIRLKELKNVGRVSGGADTHERFGINNKFTDIQAIIGLVELRSIQDKIYYKRNILTQYVERLCNVPKVNFLDCDVTNYVPWFMDVFVERREELQSYLKVKGIGTRAIYPELTSQKLNKKFLQPKSLKVSGEYTKKGLWLPSSIDLTTDQIDYVCNEIKEFYNVR